MNRIVSAVVAAVSVAAAGPALALNLCVEGAYPPFSEVAADGSVVGFDIDIGQALCKQMGETCALVKVDWDGIIPALLEKKCDAIVASMSATEERKQVIDFSAKYYQAPNRFVAKADAGLVDTPEGMAGKIVGVQRGTIHQAFMEAHYPDTELRLYASQDEANLDLAAGRVDALMADSVSLEAGFLDTDAGKGFAFFGAENYYDPAVHGSGVGDRRAQGGHRAARPLQRGDRGDPRRRHLPDDLRRVLRLRHLWRADAERPAPVEPPAAGMENLIRYAPILAQRRAGDDRAGAGVADAGDAARRARGRGAARRRAARALGGRSSTPRWCAACPTW